MENPAYFQGNYYNNALSDPKPTDHFVIEDLLDFPNDDVAHYDPPAATADTVTGNSTADTVTGASTADTVTVTSTESSTVTTATAGAVDSCNSTFSGNDTQFAGDIACQSFTDPQFSADLCLPCIQNDDMADLEWLSHFVEESFSSEDMQRMQLISGMKAHTDEASQQFPPELNRDHPVLRPEVSVPGKARSKRSRAAPCNWASRLLHVSPTASPTVTAASSSSESDVERLSTGQKTTPKKKDGAAGNNTAASDGRKCLHCATDKTPQWRTGPMGPKTLCNACGVRYKSGRLVPEYRPASSPTFVMAKHSNSHRKVLELRRQKEVHRSQQHQQQFLHQNMMFDVTNGDDYLIHHPIGPDYRQLI